MTPGTACAMLHHDRNGSSFFRENSMDQYVPLNKRSKKEQKAYHNMNRRDWHGVNPISRVFSDRKTFSRKKIKAEDRLVLKECS